MTHENKKALVVTTVASTIDQFCMNDILLLQKVYKVHVAANFQFGNNTSMNRVKEFKSELKAKDISINEIKFNRNPFSKENFFAYKELKRCIENNFFDIIHSHTPIAAMISRLAARKSRKKGTKVIYTAHGFHFYKGAPTMNWLLYYPIEKFLAKHTDVLITINKEDYARALESFKVRNIHYIPGVGINSEKIKNLKVDKTNKRKELGLPDNVFLLLSVGELNKNKNHEVVIKTLARLNNPQIHYVICGQGTLDTHLKKLLNDFGLENQVHLLGFRKDIVEICKASDVFVFPSKREGLGLAALEAMASGLPIITSNIHGIVDYSINGETGYTCNSTDIYQFSNSIEILMKDNELRIRMGKHNMEVVKKFDVCKVNNEMEKIYSSIN